MGNLVIDQSFWKNKKVLLTGHTGFKGAWLATWLIKMGAKVEGVSLEPPSSPSLFEILNLKDYLTHHHCDIRDREPFYKIVRESKAEVLFHLAAQALVRDSYVNPIETYETNVIGTLNVLEAVRQNPQIRSSVIVTSDKCYENKEWPWGYREIDPMGGFDPYSSSKGCAEILTSSYYRSYFKDGEHSQGVASGRAGNVIGGGDWAKDRIIPDLIRSIEEKRPVEIRNPQACRPWQHVLEPISGYLRLAKRLYENPKKYSQGWNFGPDVNDAQTVEWLCNTIAKYSDLSIVKKLSQSADQPHEACYLHLDSSKAKTWLNWRPNWNAETAIQKTVEWYETYFRTPEKLLEISFKQLESYGFDKSAPQKRPVEIRPTV
jgi:CDP-glucose 4,6-dehydratase